MQWRPLRCQAVATGRTQALSAAQVSESDSEASIDLEGPRTNVLAGSPTGFNKLLRVWKFLM